jgi:16S rRNA (cytidine1402-2'-O)-methyltransferase
MPCAVYGENRQAAYCRELTKKFEDIQRGTLAELLAKAQTGPVKGEIVVIIDRAQSSPVNESDIEAQLKTALQSMSVRDAAEFVAQAHGVAKRKIYQMALNIEQKP